MTVAETYRAKAAEFLGKAEAETEPIVRTEYERLVKWYLRLAEQADRNAKTDVT